MSDLLATNDTLVSPSNGQANQASDSQAQSGTDSQPSTGQVDKEQDNIRRLQSTYDKKLAEERRTFQQQQTYANQQIQQMQQRLAQMEEAAAPDDYARLELRVKRAEETAQQYAAAYQQATAAQQQERERLEALRDIADEFGVSVDDLKEATDYKSAAKLAAKKQLERDKRKQTDSDDKRDRNAPDLGVGAPRTPNTKWDMDYRDAQNRKDTAAMMRLLRTRGA